MYYKINGEVKDKLPIEEISKLFIDLNDTNDIDIRNKIIEHNIKFVLSIIKRFSNYEHLTDELLSVGLVGLIKAADSYDVNKAANFATYSYYVILNEMRMFLKREKFYLESISLENEKIIWNNQETIKLFDEIADPNADIMYNYEEKETRKELIEAIHSLNEKEQSVINLYYYYDFTQVEIAKTLGITQGQVSKILKRSINKLKKELQTKYSYILHI